MCRKSVGEMDALCSDPDGQDWWMWHIFFYSECDAWVMGGTGGDALTYPFGRDLDDDRNT